MENCCLKDERWSAKRRDSYNFVNNFEVEEQYLTLDAATTRDEGYYICKVSKNYTTLTSEFGNQNDSK